MRADLHIHSTASDGTLSPLSLVELAARNGVDIIALADHDSVSGVAAATQAGVALGVRVVPGVELSAARADQSIHILGYFVDVDDEHFRSELAALRAARLRRARTIVLALQDAGYRISLDAVLDLSRDGSVGRTHIARILVAAGHAIDVPDAFFRLLDRGMPFYRPKDLLEPRHAVKVINGAGGIAVLAHPGVSGTEDSIDELVSYGLAGIEVYHVDHSEEQKDRFAAIAASRGLLVTGGTDYHSSEALHPDLGEVGIPESDIRAFLSAGAARSS